MLMTFTELFLLLIFKVFAWAMSWDNCYWCLQADAPPCLPPGSSSSPGSLFVYLLLWSQINERQSQSRHNLTTTRKCFTDWVLVSCFSNSVFSELLSVTLTSQHYSLSSFCHRLQIIVECLQCHCLILGQSWLISFNLLVYVSQFCCLIA